VDAPDGFFITFIFDDVGVNPRKVLTHVTVDGRKHELLLPVLPP